MKKMEKGFTLVELMIVVAIIAILAAVAVPNLSASANKAKDSKGLAILGNARTNLSAAVADLGGSIPTSGSGIGLWNGSTPLVSKADTNESISAMTVGGVVAASGELKPENYGKATSGIPTLGYTETTGSNEPMEGGKNVTFTAGGNDAKGKAWASY